MSFPVFVLQPQRHFMFVGHSVVCPVFSRGYESHWIHTWASSPHESRPPHLEIVVIVEKNIWNFLCIKAQWTGKYFLIFPEPIILQNFRHFRHFKHYREVERIVLFHLNSPVVEILPHFLYPLHFFLFFFFFLKELEEPEHLTLSNIFTICS